MPRPDSPQGIRRTATKPGQAPDPRVFAQLADAHRKDGLLDEAIRVCRDGLAAHPTYVGARVVLARALMERGSLQEAEAEFRRVLAQSPENLVVIRFLGDICAKAGRPREARKYYEHVLRLKPGDPEAHEGLTALPAGEEPGAPGLPESRPERDPLATPTLAGLYAAQGHTDIAKAIYSYLGHRRTETIMPPAEKGALGRKGEPVLLDMLLAFREAARKVRHETRETQRSG